MALAQNNIPEATNIRIFIPCLIKRSQDNPPPWLRNQKIVVTRECERIEKKRRALMDKKAPPECPAPCATAVAVEPDPEAIVTLSRDAQRDAALRDPETKTAEEEAPEDVPLSRLSNKRWASVKVLMEDGAQRSAREEATQNPDGKEPPPPAAAATKKRKKRKKQKQAKDYQHEPSNTWDSFLFDRFMLQPTFNLKDYYRGTDLLPNDSGDGKKAGQGPLSVIGKSTCDDEREREVVQFRELRAYDDLMLNLVNDDGTDGRTFNQLTKSKRLIVSNVPAIQEMFEKTDDDGAAARGGRRSRRRRRRQQQTKRSSNSRKKRKTRRKRRRRRRRKTKRHSRY